MINNKNNILSFNTNPVFRRETRTAFRSLKMFIAIMAYSLVITLAAALTVYTVSYQSAYNGFNPQNMIYLYITLASFQNFLVALITPALTGNAISGERERQTLDLMLITKMSTFSVIMGKLSSSLLVVLMMIVSSLPAYGIILYFSGVSLFNLIGMTFFTMAFAGFVGCISIFFSTITKKTIHSIIFTYIVLLFITIGHVILIALFASIFWRNSYFSQNIVAAFFLPLNPVFAFLSILESQIGLNIIGDIFYAISNSNQPPNAFLTFLLKIPYWISNGLLGIILSGALISVSAYIIQPAKRKK